MKVRVWIAGADGPSRDFELLTAPSAGQRVSVTTGGKVEEGIVTDVSWHLQAIESSANELGLEGDPAGSVTLVQVVCRPLNEPLLSGFGAAEIDNSTTMAGSA